MRSKGKNKSLTERHAAGVRAGGFGAEVKKGTNTSTEGAVVGEKARR